MIWISVAARPVRAPSWLRRHNNSNKLPQYLQRKVASLGRRHNGDVNEVFISAKRTSAPRLRTSAFTQKNAIHAVVRQPRRLPATGPTLYFKVTRVSSKIRVLPPV